MLNYGLKIRLYIGIKQKTIKNVFTNSPLSTLYKMNSTKFYQVIKRTDQFEELLYKLTPIRGINNIIASYTHPTINKTQKHLKFVHDEMNRTIKTNFNWEYREKYDLISPHLVKHMNTIKYKFPKNRMIRDIKWLMENKYYFNQTSKSAWNSDYDYDDVSYLKPSRTATKLKTQCKYCHAFNFPSTKNLNCTSCMSDNFRISN